MNAPVQSKLYSIEEYLEFEAKSELRHEYEDGLILEMSGGSINHGRICGNAYAGLRHRLRDKNADCEAFPDNVKVRLEAINQFVYPDTMVVCGKVERSDKDPESIINPRVVVEVLSKSTVDYDRGDKFHKYMQLESFREYILIDQYRFVVETFYKNEQGFWEISRVTGEEGELYIKSFDFSIPLKELYQRVEFDE